MNLEELNAKIIDWAKARGIDKADPKGQFLKVVEELGELAEGMAKDKPAQIVDSFGDVLVTLIILNQQLINNGVIEQGIIECLASAYDEIKNRKGEMVNGVFVKEEDLR